MVSGGSWTSFLPGSPFSHELFVRSAQVQALSPMMQISASPWRVLDAEHQAAFLAAVRLRQKFAADIVALAKRAAKDGEPMMRSLEYAYPGRGYAKIMDEFLMGENLLVAPVVEKGATSRKVVIPPGRWLGDDGVEVEGPAEIVVNAPLKRLPYFKRISE
jgi:alpha-glucosidase (family GH31 glycosyl hydrolase)